MHPLTIRLLRVAASTKRPRHRIPGPLKDALNAWQAEGCPDLVPVDPEITRRLQECEESIDNLKRELGVR